MKMPIERDGPDVLGPISPSISRHDELILGREVRWYYGQFTMINKPEYCDVVEQIVRENPPLAELDNSIKFIITIPVHIVADYDKIYGMLSLYARQKNFDINSAIILIDLNWRKREKQNQREINRCLEEAHKQLRSARKDFPTLKIVAFEQPHHDGIFHVAKEMNDIAMIAIHHAVKAKRLSDDADIIVIRNDADMLHMHQNYLASYQKTAEENSQTPIFLGITWFDLENSCRTPGFAALMCFDRLLCVAHNMKGNIYTAGGNFAYRARHFAAVSGMGFNCYRNWLNVGSDDFQIGYRLRMAFYNQSLIQGFRICAYAPEGIIDTDGSRLFNCYAADNDFTTIDAYGTKAEHSFSNSAIRPVKLSNFAEKIDDKKSFNRLMRQFELEISDYFFFYGIEDDIVHESLDRLFETDASQFYTVKPPADPSIPKAKPSFKLNSEGRAYFKELLRRNFGDGEHEAASNKLVQAVKDGTLLRPDSFNSQAAE